MVVQTVKCRRAVAYARFLPTLYDAVVMADLEIVYRRNHSSKVDYVDPGLDATINTGTIDFTWKNNTNSDIYILASAEGKKVHIEIHGEGGLKSITRFAFPLIISARLHPRK